jgi:membrane-bound serine protease (ClpP class)
MPETMLLLGFGLMGVALLLLIVDIFIPTFGALALTSLALAIGGVVCLFRVSPTWGLIGTGMIAIGGPTVFFLGLQIMPSTPLGRKLVLGSDVGDSDDKAPPGTAGPDKQLAALIGSEAIVVSDLRPIGTVRIGDTRYDAMSTTTLVRAGATVRIVAVEASTLKVMPL